MEGRTETSARHADREPRMTTVPERRSRMCGRTAFVTLSTPKRFVWNCVSAARELVNGRVLSASVSFADSGGNAKKTHSPSLLKHGLDAVAGVVHDDVDAAPDGERGLDALRDELRGVRNVEHGKV